MSKKPHSQDAHGNKKEQQDREAPVEKDGDAPSPGQSNEQPKKSYADIMKGFEEIEKIFNRDKEKS